MEEHPFREGMVILCERVGTPLDTWELCRGKDKADIQWLDGEPSCSFSARAFPFGDTTGFAIDGKLIGIHKNPWHWQVDSDGDYLQHNW